MTLRGPNLRLEGSTLGPRKISAWREAVAPFWEVEIRKEDTPDFRGQSEVYHLGNAIIGFTAASELRIERNPGLVARMGVDHVAAMVRLEGHATVQIGGSEVPMGPGDICLLDLSQPLAIESSDYRAMTLIMPRALFPERGARLGDAHGAILRGETAFGTLVNDHLRSLDINVAHFSTSEARAAAEATATLLSMASRPATLSGGTAQASERAPVFLAIRRYIDAQIESPALGVDHLCQRFGVSRSGLYRLFAPLGGVVEYIRRRRLARAYRDLTAADDPNLRISAIAYRYGYASPASFTQAFRAEFGACPADVRAGARAEGVSTGHRTPVDLPTGGWDDFYGWVLTLDA
jgi:AraC-like DNA-binding protein